MKNNKIKDISSFEKLTTLKKLDISNNNISDIKVLSNFVNLGTLDLSANCIADFSILQGKDFKGLAAGQNITNEKVYVKNGTVVLTNPVVDYDSSRGFVTPLDISDGGVYDSAKNTITWTGLEGDGELTFSFSTFKEDEDETKVTGISGTVTVPYTNQAPPTFNIWGMNLWLIIAIAAVLLVIIIIVIVIIIKNRKKKKARRMKSRH